MKLRGSLLLLLFCAGCHHGYDKKVHRYAGPLSWENGMEARDISWYFTDNVVDRYIEFRCRFTLRNGGTSMVSVRGATFYVMTRHGAHFLSVAQPGSSAFRIRMASFSRFLMMSVNTLISFFSVSVIRLTEGSHI